MEGRGGVEGPARRRTGTASKGAAAGVVVGGGGVGGGNGGSGGRRPRKRVAGQGDGPKLRLRVQLPAEGTAAEGLDGACGGGGCGGGGGGGEAGGWAERRWDKEKVEGRPRMSFPPHFCPFSFVFLRIICHSERRSFSFFYTFSIDKEREKTAPRTRPRRRRRRGILSRGSSSRAPPAPSLSFCLLLWPLILPPASPSPLPSPPLLPSPSPILLPLPLFAASGSGCILFRQIQISPVIEGWS